MGIAFRLLLWPVPCDARALPTRWVWADPAAMRLTAVGIHPVELRARALKSGKVC
ncbi:hypothetical protein ACIQMR_35880 [Streptomyces sp. NPDC091376]|uniref:hypothetical protein n=1 Tax=Streptomyces sp. NPDC091376 TaxID=3365994 RepID=UPI0038117099